MRLLLNMNLPRDLARRLIDLGHECRHVGDIGMAESIDEDILETARKTGEVILTHDLDYGTLLAFSGASSPSVVIFRLTDIRTANLEHMFVASLPHVSELLESGAVVVVSDKAVRVRKLPVSQPD